MITYNAPTELLHHAFNVIELNRQFTSNFLFNRAYTGTKYKNQAGRKKVSNFITKQQMGEDANIIRTQRKGSGRKGRKCMVFQKKNHLPKYELVAIKATPKEFIHFLRVWNQLKDNVFVTCKEFKELVESDKKIVYDFLRQLAINDFAIKICHKPLTYQKIGTVSKKMMKDTFVMYRKQKIEQVSQTTGGITMPKVQKVIPVKTFRSVPAKTKEVDLTAVPLSTIGSSIINELIERQKKIDILAGNKETLLHVIDEHLATIKTMKAEQLRMERILASRNAEIEALKGYPKKDAHRNQTVNLKNIFSNRK